MIALDKYTGKEVWRALPSDDSEPRYSQPILIHHGRAQLVVWHATALESVDPETGALRVTMNTPIATPACRRPVTPLLRWFGIRTGHSY